ncbi:tryptorubin family RiPP precursor [Kitasatospora sp. NPDC093102]|uniref:tryptorubin family RiPP precursor n=1 Tax=Kitasatospora sp. NPDC093102 TaxID=3155069 RepID=UPI0034263557
MGTRLRGYVCRASAKWPYVHSVTWQRKGDPKMKILFAIRNASFAKKSLKASAWYIWY